MENATVSPIQLTIQHTVMRIKGLKRIKLVLLGFSCSHSVTLTLKDKIFNLIVLTERSMFLPPMVKMGLARADEETWVTMRLKTVFKQIKKYNLTWVDTPSY